MNLLDLHRKIPLLRRPFHQRDEAILQRDQAITRLNAALKALNETTRERDSALLSLSLQSEALEALSNHPGAGGRPGEPSPEAAASTFHFRGYDIPLNLMMLTGGGPETFAEISDGHIASLKEHVGLEPAMSILEIGCGIGRDAIPLTEILSAQAGGRYIGIDIIRPSIDWCVRNIHSRHQNFVFHHMDIADQLHNPCGTVSASRNRLPVVDQIIDRVILQSVFTHMLPAELEHYLSELKRVMRPEALAFITVFIYDDAVLASTRHKDRLIYGFQFAHEVVAGCRVNSLEFPTGSVAYTEAFLSAAISRNGLRHARQHLKGAWSGHHTDAEYGQDVLILTPN